jgi:hypothetical protein
MLTTGKAMGAGGARPAATTIALAASANGGGSTVTYPTTVLAGDILVVGIYTYADTSGGVPATPSGWTQIGYAAAAPWAPSPPYRVMAALYYRVATGTEGSSTSGFTFAADAGGTNSAVAVYRPSFSTASASLGDVVATNSTAAEVISSGSATAGYKGVISCLAWSTYSPSPFCTSSPSPDLNVQISGGSGGQLIGKSFGSSSAVDVTVTLGTGSFGSARVSAYIRLV